MAQEKTTSAYGIEVLRAFRKFIRDHQIQTISHGYFSGKPYSFFLEGANKDLLTNGTCSGMSYAHMRAYLESPKKARALSQLYQDIVDGKHDDNPAIFEILISKILFYSNPSLLIPKSTQNNWQAIDNYEREHPQDPATPDCLNYSKHYLIKTGGFFLHLTSTDELIHLLKTYQKPNYAYAMSSDVHTIARMVHKDKKSQQVRNKLFDPNNKVGRSTGNNSPRASQIEDLQKKGTKIQAYLSGGDHNITLAQIEYKHSQNPPSAVFLQKTHANIKAISLYKEILLNRLEREGWQGLRLNDKDEFDCTSLHMATIYDDIASIKALLNIGELIIDDILANEKLCEKLLDQRNLTDLLQDKQGRRKLKVQLTEKLKPYDTDARLTARDGITALQFSATNNNLEVVELLLHRFNNNIRTNETKLIKEIINEKDKNGDTLLHHAARNGHKKTVLFLLENGADKHIKNNAGETAKSLSKNYTHTKTHHPSSSVDKASKKARKKQDKEFKKFKASFLNSSEFNILEKYKGKGNKKALIIEKYTEALRNAENKAQLAYFLENDFQLNGSGQLEKVISPSKGEVTLKRNTGIGDSMYSFFHGGNRSTSEKLVNSLSGQLQINNNPKFGS